MEQLVSTNKWQIIAKFSLIYSLILIAINLILYITGMQAKSNIINSLVLILTIIGSIYFGVVSLRDNTLGGYISYGKSVSTGLWISLFAGIIVSMYTYLFTTIIDPDFMENMMTEVKRKMIEDGESEEKIEMAMVWWKKLNSPGIFTAMGFFGNLFYGLIGSLIIAIFTKKEDPDAQYNSLNQ